MAYEMTLLSTEVRTLRAANEALSKRRRAKKSRVRQGGTLTVENAHYCAEGCGRAVATRRTCSGG
jgi:hypothetical protein